MWDVRIALLGVVTACASSPAAHVRVHANETTPLFASYREMGKPWEEATRNNTEYDFDATDDFQFVVVCENADLTFVAEELDSNVGDGTEWTITPYAALFPPSGGCAPPAGTDVPFFLVSGSVLQPGTVTLGTSVQDGTVDGWNYQFSVPTATYDLTAVGNTSAGLKMIVQRGQLVSSTTTEPQLDLDNGFALDNDSIAVSGVDVGDSVEATLSLLTVNQTDALTSVTQLVADSTNVALQAEVPPQDSIASSDQVHTYVLSLQTSGTEQILKTAQFDHYQMDVQMQATPSVQFSVQNSSVAVDWSSTEGDATSEFELVVRNTPNPPTSESVQHVFATGHWIRDNTPGSLLFDASSPQYDPSWTIDPSLPNARAFTMRRISSDSTYEVIVGGTD